MFDISSEYKYKNILASNIFCDEDEDTAYIWKNKIQKNVCTMDVSLYIRKGEMFERVSEEHKHYIHSTSDILTTLEKHNFKSEAYKCFSLDEPKENGERIQFVAIKEKK